MALFLMLPNELLQDAAFCLTFSSFFRLQNAIRRLHNVCNQRLVLQTVADAGFHTRDDATETLRQAYFASTVSSLNQNSLNGVK
jgi:hypothetical protein